MRKGFTLIELLIVVAIIAILAAIAVPNFLEAQTRAKVSRAASDMRSISTAIEAYAVDNTKYPPAVNYASNSLRVIFGGVPSGSVTTPIAYMTTLPADPFETYSNGSGAVRPGTLLPFGYEKAGFGWVSAGDFPDGPYTVKASGGFVVQLPTDYVTEGIDGVATSAVFVRDPNQTPRRWVLWSIGPSDELPSNISPTSRYSLGSRYDPTNGTVSTGYLLRYAGGPSFPAK